MCYAIFLFKLYVNFKTVRLGRAINYADLPKKTVASKVVGQKKNSHERKSKEKSFKEKRFSVCINLVQLR